MSDVSISSSSKLWSPSGATSADNAATSPTSSMASKMPLRENGVMTVASPQEQTHHLRLQQLAQKVQSGTYAPSAQQIADAWLNLGG